jgi:DNA-binding CsgD family transcriptional regulator
MTQEVYQPTSPTGAPRWVGEDAEKVLAARGRPERLKRVFDASLVPMLLVDPERRFVEVNTPARLAWRLTLAQLRLLKIEDLTPESLLGTMEAAWGRLIATGCVAGPYSVALPDGSTLEVTYFGLANALPDRHLIMFAPAEWPDEELLPGSLQLGADGVTPLTPRELQVLQLAAEGRSAPLIAVDLGVSVATVRTHFGNIYDKLEVGDRAAAVAKAMRLGMIT